jgi:hypothetical protein
VLQLSSEVPCGALLALRAAPRASASLQLRLLRGAQDFTVGALSGDIR